MTKTSSDAQAVSYELNRLEELLIQFEETPHLREQLIKTIDYAAWEQLRTALRGLRQTVRNVGSQLRGPRLPHDDIE